ncbi:hypothetical protein MASR2M48_11500 [Spirochaetota bacterium]
MKRKAIKAHWFLWVIIGMCFLVSILLYSKLPEQLPMHWNAKGEIDRYGSKFEGAFVDKGFTLWLVVASTILAAAIPSVYSYIFYRKLQKDS